MTSTDGKSVTLSSTEREAPRPAESTQKGRRFVRFFGEAKQEISKITWTTKQELKSYTTVVVVATFVFGVLIYVADLVLHRVLGGVGALLRLMGG